MSDAHYQQINKKSTQYLPLHGVYFYVMNHYYMTLEGLTYNTMNTVIQDYNTDCNLSYH